MRLGVRTRSLIEEYTWNTCSSFFVIFPQVHIRESGDQVPVTVFVIYLLYVYGEDLRVRKQTRRKFYYCERKDMLNNYTGGGKGSTKRIPDPGTD